MRKGVLLINLGTPTNTSLREVGRYLHEFLSDPRVVDLPLIVRKILLYSVILPIRTRKSAQAYKKIWSESGSPLLINSQNLALNLQNLLQEQYCVELAMRYGQPSIKTSLAKLLKQNLEELIIIPLFPQYSSAATGSAIAKVLQELAKYLVIPRFSIINNYYQHPSYISAIANSIKQYHQSQQHLVFSFHGLPLRQNMAVCNNLCASNCTCYKNQCLQTAHLVAQELGLVQHAWSVAFQSRLGRIKWLQPYLEQHLMDLYAQGVRHLCVISPGFVADCLETLEELGMQLKDLWLSFNNTTFTLIPCLNADFAPALLAMLNSKY
jgi:ferrochelatase